ncbi:MAG: L-2-amino-thiazoline-4-carboxylic acid hydrolase [Actinomycetes bacterium]
MTESRIAPGTLRMFQEYHWLMLRVFYDASQQTFGDAGVEAVRRGAHAAGYYRGARMRDRATSFVHPRNALSLVEQWDTGEWELAFADSEIRVEGTTSDLILELDHAPGHAYFIDLGLSPAMLDIYWPALLAGIAQGYGSNCQASVVDDVPGKWRVRIVLDDGAAKPAQLVLGAVMGDELSLLEMSRRTSGLIAALQMYVSRELVRDFDAEGEQVIREASYEFGALRGSVIREKHLREGVPITLANFASKSGLQERDPSEAVFVFSDRQHVSEGAYYLDCTFCPLQEVWAHEGAEGLRLGYLFDASNHRGLFQSYHPETVVRWDSVKTRGDSVCRFRFTVPSLLTSDDPSPEEFDAIR